MWKHCIAFFIRCNNNAGISIYVFELRKKVASYVRYFGKELCLMEVKMNRVILLLIFIALTFSICLVSSEAMEATSRTGKSMTVIEPTKSGGVHILEIEEETNKTLDNTTKEQKTIEAQPISPNGQHTNPSPRIYEKKRMSDIEIIPDTPDKARIIVVPAIYSQGARSKFERELYEKFNMPDPTLIENPGFTGHLVNSLVNSRKFDVLERADLRSVIKEIDFGESDYADPTKVARMGKMLNADYVVIPEIRYILFISKTKEIPYIPRANIQYEATMGTNIRVVDVRTTRLASSSIDETTYTERKEKRESAQLKQALNLIDNFFNAVAEKEVSRIIDIVYPIKIIEIDGQNVTLNRGTGAMSPGEILQVFSPGKVLIDPDTHENLGYSEALVGKVEVIEVKAKVSVARILSGEVHKFDLCRRSREIKQIKEKPVPKID